MMHKKNVAAWFIIAVTLIGIGVIYCWWLLQPATSSIESSHSVAISGPGVATITSIPSSRSSQTGVISPEQIITVEEEDYFEKALALHKLALAGDSASQLALGNILEVCAPVAYERDVLQNYLQLLHAYRNKLPAEVLPRFENIMQRCVHFYPENLLLFYPDNEQFKGQSLQINEIIDYLPLTWKALAAAGGNEKALIDIVQPLPLPTKTVNIDDPQVKFILQRQLEAGNPDLLWKVSYCLPDQQISLRTALLEMAYEQTQYNPLSFQMFRFHASTLHATSQYNSQASMEILEDSLPTYNLSQAINILKESEQYVPIKIQQVQKNLQDPTFRAGLIENCAVHMRQ